LSSDGGARSGDRRQRDETTLDWLSGAARNRGLNCGIAAPSGPASNVSLNNIDGSVATNKAGRPLEIQRSATSRQDREAVQ
jgi:hypothetical protein